MCGGLVDKSPSNADVSTNMLLPGMGGEGGRGGGTGCGSLGECKEKKITF